MKTYILRIYRNESKNSSSIVGVVEEVGKKGRKPFANFDQLWNLLKDSSSLLSSKKLKTEEKEIWEESKIQWRGGLY